MSETSGSSPYGDESLADGWLIDSRDVDPPERDDIVRGLLITGDAFTTDFIRLKSHLDRIAPVRAFFDITSTPRGFAPEDIRQQWVGVTLPMRGYFDPRDGGVCILAREALELLKAKSPAAHRWWQQHYAEEAHTKVPNVDPEGFPEFLANISYLVFDLDCGKRRSLTGAPLLSETRGKESS